MKNTNYKSKRQFFSSNMVFRRIIFSVPLLFGLFAWCNPVSDTNLEKSIANVGAKIYSDRDYTIASIPGFLEGGVSLLSRNADREKVGEGTLGYATLSRESDVYVAFLYPRLPRSYSAFRSTELRIQIKGYLGKERHYHVWEAMLPVGVHTFSGVNSQGAYGFIDSPFFLFEKGKNVENQREENCRISRGFGRGSLFYFDRDYVISTIPDKLVGLSVGMTQNNDKMRPDSQIEDLYRFSLAEKTKVYLATDTGGVPSWLRSYKMLSGNKRIRVNYPVNKEKPARTQYFSLFKKRAFEGEKIEFGYPTDSLGSSKNLYIVFVIPVD